MTATVQKNIIRGPNLRILRTSDNLLGSFEAYMLARGKNRALASNKRMTKALVETDEWKSIKRVFPIRTGTMTAYVEPDTPLIRSKMFSKNDNALVYVDLDLNRVERWLFLLSGLPAGCVNEPTASCLDEPNVILVAEHPDYSLEKRNGKDIIVTPREVVGLSGFPTENGWYHGDPDHDIPLGPQISNPDDSNLEDRDSKARFLIRTQLNEGCVGLVVRGRDGWYHDDGLDVDLDSGASGAFMGVAVEASEGKKSLIETVTGFFRHQK
jgi:hypothetical protein